jgi:hypothetical protein
MEPNRKAPPQADAEVETESRSFPPAPPLLMTVTVTTFPAVIDWLPVPFQVEQNDEASMACEYVTMMSKAADLRVAGTVVLDDQVQWVQMELPRTKSKKVRIEIRTPEVNGKRQLWQFCDMAYAGVGTYRCGLDVSGSTPAKSMGGQWLGKLKVDGTTVGRVKFSTTR